MKTKTLEVLTSHVPARSNLSKGLHQAKAGLFLFVLLASGLTLGLRAQEGPLDYVAQALSKAVAAATWMNLAQYDYQPGNSLLGVWLANGQSQALRNQLDAGVQYLLIGCGDEDIIDLDLTVRTENGFVVAQDTDADATPIVEFTPVQTADYLIELKNYRSTRVGVCAVVLLRKSSSGQLSLKAIGEALRNAMMTSRSAQLLASQPATGSFCIFGGRVDAGQEQCLYDIALPAARYLALAAGTDRIGDVDATVTEQYRTRDPAGRLIAEDRRYDRTANCVFEAKAGNFYRVAYKNSSNSSGFIFTTVLRLRDGPGRFE